MKRTVWISWQSHVNYEYKPRQQQQHSGTAMVFESKALRTLKTQRKLYIGFILSNRHI